MLEGIQQSIVFEVFSMYLLKISPETVVLSLDVLSLQTFCLDGCLVFRTFCPTGRFVPPDVLSQYVMSTDFMSLAVMSLDVLSPDLLSLWTLCLRMFCLGTIGVKCLKSKHMPKI